MYRYIGVLEELNVEIFYIETDLEPSKIDAIICAWAKTRTSDGKYENLTKFFKDRHYDATRYTYFINGLRVNVPLNLEFN